MCPILEYLGRGLRQGRGRPNKRLRRSAAKQSDKLAPSHIASQIQNPVMRVKKQRAVMTGQLRRRAAR